MHNDVTRLEARAELWFSSKAGENIFNMATVVSECVEAFCRLSEVVQTNEDASSVENSCPGVRTFDNSEMNCKTPYSSTNKAAKRSGASGGASFAARQEEIQGRDNDVLNTDSNGWAKSLLNLPVSTHEELEKKLVRNSQTMPDNVALKAHRNMKKGYGLWKEGYVKNILFRPNVSASKLLFLVKA